MPWYTTQHARRDAERQAAERAKRVRETEIFAAVQAQPMHKDAFIKRAQHRYVDKAGMTYAEAAAFALILWDDGKALDDLNPLTPEDMVDEDLTNYGD